MEKLRIVYLGTPDFAVEPLRRLVERQKSDENCGFEVVGVVTMPDKMINKRGTQLLMSPVKEYAVENDIPLLQPVSLKDEEFQAALAAWRADLQIVVASVCFPRACGICHVWERLICTHRCCHSIVVLLPLIGLL